MASTSKNYIATETKFVIIECCTLHEKLQGHQITIVKVHNSEQKKTKMQNSQALTALQRTSKSDLNGRIRYNQQIIVNSISGELPKPTGCVNKNAGNFESDFKSLARIVVTLTSKLRRKNSAKNVIGNTVKTSACSLLNIVMAKNLRGKAYSYRLTLRYKVN